MLPKVPTWYLVSRMQCNFVYRGIISIPLNFRLLQVFICFLAVLLPLSCEVWTCECFGLKLRLWNLTIFQADDHQRTRADQNCYGNDGGDNDLGVVVKELCLPSMFDVGWWWVWTMSICLGWRIITKFIKLTPILSQCDESEISAGRPCHVVCFHLQLVKCRRL